MGKAVLERQHFLLSFVFMSLSLNLCWILAFWLSVPDPVSSHPSMAALSSTLEQITLLWTPLQPQHGLFSLPIKNCYAVVNLWRKGKKNKKKIKGRREKKKRENPYRIIKTIHSLPTKKAKKLTLFSENSEMNVLQNITVSKWFSLY